MPYMLYIFIISCILRLSSETVIMEEMFSFFNFSSFTSSLSSPRAFLKISLSFSPSAFRVSASSSAVSALKVSVSSASMRRNLTFSFFCSSWLMKGESMLWGRMTASMPSSLNMLMYWLCSFSSVT